MKQQTINDLRKHFPRADSYLGSLVLSGEMPKCNYPSNGVPKLRKNPKPVSVDELFAVGENRG